MIIAERIMIFICIFIAVYMIYKVGYMNGFGTGMDKACEILERIFESEDDDGEEEET